MNTALMRATQMSFTLSVRISTDREAELLMLLILILTPFLILWQMKQKVYQIRAKLGFLIADAADLFSFVSKVIAITFKSFAFGLGIVR